MLESILIHDVKLKLRDSYSFQSKKSFTEKISYAIHFNQYRIEMT